jgi:PhzF family phenazine biosynthesis protein
MELSNRSKKPSLTAVNDIDKVREGKTLSRRVYHLASTIKTPVVTMNVRFHITDVFAENPLQGNQLATFFDFGALETGQMQRIAREINFSETTFITSREENNGGYDVRIFTPNEEIPFAGHPTLGTAYLIRLKMIGRKIEKVTLNLRVGQIPVTFPK